AQARGGRGGAGGDAIVPTAAGIELADEIEEARGGGFEVHRQLGDLVTEVVELDDVRMVGRTTDHGESPFCLGDSTPDIWSHLHAPRTRDRHTMRIFRGDATRRRIARFCARLSRHFPIIGATRRLRSQEAVKHKIPAGAGRSSHRRKSDRETVMRVSSGCLRGDAIVLGGAIQLNRIRYVYAYVTP